MLDVFLHTASLLESHRLVEQREDEDAYRLEAPQSAFQVGIEDIATGSPEINH